jgi:hypothetical protein
MPPRVRWYRQITQERVAPAEGFVTPRGPGLGMAWDEAAVARCGA